jgi:hypothetical protein
MERQSAPTSEPQGDEVIKHVNATPLTAEQKLGWPTSWAASQKAIVILKACLRDNPVFPRRE